MDELVRLAPGHMLCILDGVGVRILVEQGHGVITQEHDADDTVFRGGSVFMVGRPGKTIVMARRESSLRLQQPRGCARPGRIETKKYVGPRAVVLRRLAPAH